MVNMRAGDIVFVRGNSLISNAVRYFDKGEFSHVAIAVSSTHVLEAQYSTKVRMTPFYFEDYEVVDLGLTDEERNRVVHLGVQQTGKWYDYSQIAWYILKKVFNLEGDNLLNSPNNLICSELVSNILILLGKISVNERVVDFTPNELYNFLQNFIVDTEISV